MWTNSSLELLIPQKWRIRNPMGLSIQGDWDWTANAIKLKYVIKHSLNGILKG